MTFDDAEATFRRLVRERLGTPEEAANPLPDDGVLIPASKHVALAGALKAAGWRMYLSCCATHFPGAPAKKPGEEPTPETFEVATLLRTVGPGTHIARWRVRLQANESLDTLVPLFAGADWQEREQWDLVGVRFAGHPDLRRVMLPEDWVGHPLRRDYPIETPHAPWR